MNRTGQLWGLAWLSVLCLLGCDSTHSIGSLDAKRLQASPYSRIGTITLVDPASATVVVRLDNVNTDLAGELVARDPRLNVTASLKPTGIRTGRSVGMVIVQGKPGNGEVVSKKEGN